MSAATYANPVSVDRKPWGRRIEVFSAKLDRRLTLLCWDAHDVWLLLEGDFRVKRFCERPAYVADAQGRLLPRWLDRRSEISLARAPVVLKFDDNRQYYYAGASCNQWDAVLVRRSGLG